jgi:hypothetical protein
MLGCSHRYPRSSRTGGPVGGKLPVNLQIGAYHPFMPYQLSAFSSYDNDEVQEYDYGLTPGVKSNPSHAREHCTDEKRYPHADLEEHNHIDVAWSRHSKKAFVHCIASVRAVPVPGAAAVRP